jgi:hypothetical protein
MSLSLGRWAVGLCLVFLGAQCPVCCRRPVCLPPPTLVRYILIARWCLVLCPSLRPAAAFGGGLKVRILVLGVFFQPHHDVGWIVLAVVTPLFIE